VTANHHPRANSSVAVRRDIGDYTVQWVVSRRGYDVCEDSSSDTELPNYNNVADICLPGNAVSQGHW